VVNKSGMVVLVFFHVFFVDIDRAGIDENSYGFWHRGGISIVSIKIGILMLALVLVMEFILALSSTILQFHLILIFG